MAFITTIIATLIGGVLAIGTSVVVKRWEFRQETRIRMFDELLPEVAGKYFSWRDTEGKSFTAKVSKEIGDVRVIRRTTTQPVRSIKGQRPRTATSVS